MIAALGRDSLGIRLLKPKGEGDNEHMPIDRVSVSGGELLTAAMMIYLVLARLRAEAMHGGAGEGGVLIMDNPLGKANKALLLKTQIGLADAMGIQLFYTTGRAGHERACRVREHRAAAAHRSVARLAPHPRGGRGYARPYRQADGRRHPQGRPRPPSSMSPFADELRALGKRRIGLPELRAAWLRAQSRSSRSAGAEAPASRRPARP